MDGLRTLNYLLATATALVVTLCLGGVLSDRLDILNHFMPLYGVAALAAGAASLALGPQRARATRILAVYALLVAGCFVLPEFAARFWSRTATPAHQTVKVIQFNLWGHNRDPQATAAWVIAQKPDVVVAEEAIDKGAAAAATLGAAFPYHVDCPVFLECTTLIFSKSAPQSSGALESPDSFGRHSTVWARFGRGQSAYAVAGVHILWPIPGGAQQAHLRSIAAGLSGLDHASLILAGDFNATPWSFSLARVQSLFGVERRSHALFSWPVKPYSGYRVDTPTALLPLDHVFAGPSWKTVSAGLGPRLGSAHLPVVVVLTR